MKPNAAAAREAARQTDGRFGTQERAEADLGPGGLAIAADDDTAVQIEAAAAHLPPFTTVWYVDRDDQLTSDEIASLLSGDTDAAFISAADRFAESAQTYAEADARQAWQAAYDADEVSVEWDDLDWDDQATMRDRVYERDNTDLVADLDRNTPPQLMRTRLDGGLNARLTGTSADAWSGQRTFNDDDSGRLRQARVDAVTSTLAAHGIDTTAPEVTEAIDELVDNGPYDWHEGVDLDVIFYAPISEASPAPAPGSSTSLTFHDPRVVLIDRWNGSGHDVKIPGTLTKAMPAMPDEGGLPDEARVYTDDNAPAGGYSWDAVCGLHKPAYATGIERTVTGGGQP